MASVAFTGNGASCEGGNKVAAELGEKAQFVQTDISDEASVQNCMDTAVESFGPINGLVNCAGIPGAERVVGREGPHRLATFERALKVNLLGTFNMIRLAADKMQSNAADAVLS